MSIKMNLNFAALLCDEVRHNRPKFDICRKVFFGNLAMRKSNFSLHLSIELNFSHTSKKVKGGSPKKILEKKNVFPKKYVELRTFDGTHFIPFCRRMEKFLCTGDQHYIP